MLLASALSLLALNAAASSTRALTAQLSSAEKQAKVIAAQPWSAEAEAALVDRIDSLCDGFHEAAAEGAKLSEQAARLLSLAERTRARYTKVLERMQAEVIEADGDLEAVQDSAAWRERELLAMRLLYRINWLHYEIAMRFERSTTKRKQHLLAARSGFSEFVYSPDTELAQESLFGRGLANKTLKRHEEAVADFNAILAASPPPELAQRVRIALAESLMSANKVAAALKVTARLIEGSPRGEVLEQIRFLRTKALLLALDAPSSDSSLIRQYRDEAAKLLETLYKSGSYWKTKALQLIDAGIRNPGLWASQSPTAFITWLVAESERRRGDCASAALLYRSLIERGAYTSESRYGLGFCAFHDGDYEGALELLSAFIESAKSGHAYLPKAAYLRFKAAESLYLRSGKGPASESARRYISALNSFLQISPSHDNAYEAWFRLGEWRRDAGDYAACAEAFSKVRGETSFRLKAAFLAAECAFRQVEELPESAAVPAEQARAALEAVDVFLSEASAFRESKKNTASQLSLLAPMEAHAVIMGASLVAKIDGGNMKERLRRLEGFEQRFPKETKRLPELLSLRVVAYRVLGDMDAAGAELERLLALKDIGEYGRKSLKKLGIAFLNEAAMREQDGDAEGALRARRVALAIYERVLADARVQEVSEGLAGLESLVADLRRDTAGLGQN